MFWLYFFLGWFLLSIVGALLFGAFIHAGRGCCNGWGRCKNPEGN